LTKILEKEVNDRKGQKMLRYCENPRENSPNTQKEKKKRDKKVRDVVARERDAILKPVG